MRHNIAIIGAGITGVMTALACARQGASVDLYDAGTIPNTTNLSWAHGRLWKHIHENNASLQPLAAHSHAFWRDFIGARDGMFGCKTQSIRIVDDNTCDRLVQAYQELAIGYDIHDRALSVQSSLLNLPCSSTRMFVGHDAILLNARKIYEYLCYELTECKNVSIKPHTYIDLTSISEGRLLYVEGSYKEYAAIICATGYPMTVKQNEGKVRPRPKYQVHLDVHVDDARAAMLKPVLNMGDEHLSWCVPSPDRTVLKVSASRFSYAEHPSEECVLSCKEYLLSRVRVEYKKIETYVSPYFELPSEERQSSSYWHHHCTAGCIVIDACDASIFKIAPTLSEQISHHVIHGANE
jgi:hypothetical protein